MYISLSGFIMTKLKLDNSSFIRIQKVFVLGYRCQDSLTNLSILI
jgi:hypothetical protein